MTTKTNYTNPITNTLTPTKRIVAQACYMENDTHLTGINNNDLIVGVSGAGKTRSYVIPNILHANESMIVVDTKNTLYKTLSSYLRNKGFTVWCLNFANPRQSNIGYNPMRFIKRTKMKYAATSYSTQDVETLSSYLCPIEIRSDPFWDYAARMYLTSYIAYTLEALPSEEQHLGTVSQISKMSNTPQIDALFEEWGCAYPDSFAYGKWTLSRGGKRAEKTDASIQMIANEKLATFESKSMQDMFSASEQLDFRFMAQNKTVLFVNVSDTDRSNDRLLNLLYAQALHELCDYADEQKSGKLKVPVRIILDDFAAQNTIPAFDKIISTIRSRDIYASIILQSLSQLTSLYGDGAARTIINNCDTMLYLGGQDIDTAHHIAQKANVPTVKILELPVGDALLFVRGQKPKRVEKYNLEDDVSYQSLRKMPLRDMSLSKDSLIF